jgi:hypothetical protein
LRESDPTATHADEVGQLTLLKKAPAAVSVVSMVCVDHDHVPADSVPDETAEPIAIHEVGLMQLTLCTPSPCAPVMAWADHDHTPPTSVPEE